MRYVFLAISLFWGFLSGAQPLDFTVYGPRITANYQLDKSAFLPVDRLSLDEIEGALPSLPSYEAFLDYLEKRRPSLLENWVLVHDTGSLQYADREHPRVILFGDGLLLAFAEDPNRPDRTVEIISFDVASSRFRFAELQFGADGPRFLDEPKNCESCHGSPAKPLWDPYDFWPNVYGSSISRFGAVSEKSAYERVRTRANKQGIYGKLRWLVPSPDDVLWRLKGTETLTQYLSQLQIFSSLARWQKQPQFKRVVPALLAVTNLCAENPRDETAAARLGEFFPEPWKSLVETKFASWHQRVRENRQRFKSYQDARYQELFPNSSTLFAVDHERLASETQTVAQLFFVLELAGVDTSDFTMSQGPNAFLMSVPSSFDADLSSNLAQVAPEVFESLAPTLTQAIGTDYSWAQFDCARLKAESLRSLEGELPAESPSARFAPTVFGECIGCHSFNPGAQGAPPIPFDRTGKLREYMKSHGIEKILERVQRSGQGQMPPYRKLSAEEQAHLRFNLEQIQGLER